LTIIIIFVIFVRYPSRASSRITSRSPPPLDTNNATSRLSSAFTFDLPTLTAPSRGTAGASTGQISTLRLNTLALNAIPDPTRLSLFALASLTLLMRRPITQS
jgi:hypothetical protein